MSIYKVQHKHEIKVGDIGWTARGQAWLRTAETAWLPLQAGGAAPRDSAAVAPTPAGTLANDLAVPEYLLAAAAVALGNARVLQGTAGEISVDYAAPGAAVVGFAAPAAADAMLFARADGGTTWAALLFDAAGDLISDDGNPVYVEPAMLA